MKLYVIGIGPGGEEQMTLRAVRALEPVSYTHLPQAISEALLGLTQNPIIILLIMNVIVLIAGTFMDVTPAILIFTPLFLPVVKTFGMDPVQFGLILVYNLCIGNITPPVGNTLFVAIKVGRSSLSKVMPYMLWYYICLLYTSNKHLLDDLKLGH